MHIVYIHGNAATMDSFNFIRSQLPDSQDILLEYDSKKGFDSNYQEMLERLSGVDDIFFVAHSLGGIYALHLANDLPEQVLGAVTLSTPYGGSRAAQLVQYVLPFSQVLQDIQPHSAPIAKGHGFKILHPWTNIVSTGGNSSLMPTPNDGVVSQYSMRYRQDMALVDVPSNHYEVLLSHEAVAVIKKAIKGVTGKAARRSPVKQDVD